MRYPPEHKASTRRRILEAASRVFREHGAEGASLPAIMAEAGLTIGGFYRHFDSKEELFREAFAGALGETTEKLRSLPEHLHGERWIRDAAAIYLHPAHVDNHAQGCPLPALAADVRRQGEEAQRASERQLAEMIEALAERIGGDPAAARSRSWGLLASLVGGLTLARGVADRELASEILNACREWISSREEDSA